VKKYKIVIDFLRVIGATREAGHYLKLFQKGNPARFAVIRISGKVIEKSCDLISMDLAYLSNLNLYPIVIHGGGFQIDNELARRNIRFEKIDGQRVTTKFELPIIKSTLDKINSNFVNEIRKFNGSACGLTEDIFIAKKHPNEKLGYVGVVEKVLLAPIIRAIKNKKIPVISCFGFDERGNFYNINADTAARALVLAVKPKKYILVTDEGGVRDANGKIIPNINLSAEMTLLKEKNILQGGMLYKVAEIKNLLDEVRYNLPVQITSSGRLLKELFTDKGSGTFIKRGATIIEYKMDDKIDKDKLKMLIEKSFGRTLKDDYFKKPFFAIFLDKKYRGAAIVRLVKGMHYLDKFCVKKESQGEGIASDLWHYLTERCKNLFWRSRPDNPINTWYFEKSDGVLKFNKWFLFWINLNDDEVKKAKDFILNLEESFVPQEPKRDS